MPRVTWFRGFGYDCPYCGKRFRTSTSLVLEQQVREHVPACFEAAKKRTERELEAAAQLNLQLGGDS